MKQKRILFISQEIAPYVPSSPVADMCAKLPLLLQGNVGEIRLFMPRWGNINERRNQLHEVKRLSGMNVIIDDTDHTLVIKVSSMPNARSIQVFFIDCDDFFQIPQPDMADVGCLNHANQAACAIFFARGILETVNKMRWMPDIIHCSGWIASLLSLYLRTAYMDEPPFAQTKIIFSAFGDVPKQGGGAKLREMLQFRTLTDDVLKQSGVDFNASDVLAQLALTYSDGFVQAQRGVAKKVMKLALSKGLPVLEYPGVEQLAEAHRSFYERILSGE